MAAKGIPPHTPCTHTHTSPLIPCRPSANLAALNGGVQPSLEQLRPDMFFGADDAEDDDASSGVHERYA